VRTNPNRHEFAKEGQRISPVAVRGVWLRHDLETTKKRLEALEAKCRRCYVLTDAQLVALERNQREKRVAT
jgi:hypothetical protein